MSRERLARKADVSTRTIYRLESGETKSPREEEFQKIATALGTTVDDLMGIVDESEEDDEEAISLADMQRRLMKMTGSRNLSIGMINVGQNWDRLTPGARKLIEAAFEAAMESPPGPKRLIDAIGGDEDGEESPE
ncbi:MAG: helix-turn-helix transcriptional regulator [Hyphomicrobiales bacterium]|nr:helix-turn-helix transcriptional regulator [Hyphomicrobiales bacterium]